MRASRVRRWRGGGAALADARSDLWNQARRLCRCIMVGRPVRLPQWWDADRARSFGRDQGL